MPTPEEARHIDTIGKAEFHKRLVLANMAVRNDARFVGLENLRSRVAFQAALQATGFRQRELVLPNNYGPITVAVEELFAKAIAAARG